MAFPELIYTVVSSEPALVPRTWRRPSRRGDVSQADLILNDLKRFMVALEHCWKRRFTRSSGKSACAGNDSIPLPCKLRHHGVAPMAADMAL